MPDLELYSSKRLFNQILKTYHISQLTNGWHPTGSSFYYRNQDLYNATRRLLLASS